MSWVKVGDETASTGATFANYKCKVCGRRCTTCGSEPSLLCVCNPAPRPKRRDSGGMRRRR